MTNEKKWRKYLIPGVLLFTWMIFNLVLLFRHELWRDEANVWLMAKNLNPIQLLAEIKYQGHPCLWYLFVMPFAKMGLPFITIDFLSFSIMTATAVIFLWKAPIHMWAKTICLFSPIFCYFYTDIARNYCLIALFMVLLAWLYPKRYEKPVLYGLLLGLLVQSDTIALAAAGLISLMWLSEGCFRSIKSHSLSNLLKVAKGIWLPFVSLLLWIAQFYQVSDSQHFQINTMGLGELVRAIVDYVYSILIRLTGWGKLYCTIALVLWVIIALIVIWHIHNAWAAVIMAGSCFFQAFFSVVVYQLHIWHYISLCFVYIWMLWIWYNQEKETIKPAEKNKVWKIVACVAELWLAVLAISMFVHWNSPEEASNFDNALHGLYSDGVNVADYIRENLSQDDIIVASDVPMASTVVAYLQSYTIYYAGTGQVITYADYSEEQEQSISQEQLLQWAKEKFPDKTEIYILNHIDALESNNDDILPGSDILYRSQTSTARGEEYVLYSIPLNQ